MVILHKRLKLWQATKVLKILSQNKLIKLDDEMDTMQKIGGTRSQPESYWRPKLEIPPNLLLVF